MIFMQHYHRGHDLSLIVHGDDFTSLGLEADLHWLTSRFRETFKIKLRGILGTDAHDTHELTLLNRVVSWKPDGIRFEADQRHAEILLNTLGYNDVKGVCQESTWSITP